MSKRRKKLVSRRALLRAMRQDRKRWLHEYESGMSGERAKDAANCLEYWIGFVRRMKVWR